MTSVPWPVFIWSGMVSIIIFWIECINMFFMILNMRSYESIALISINFRSIKILIHSKMSITCQCMRRILLWCACKENWIRYSYAMPASDNILKDTHICFPHSLLTSYLVFPRLKLKIIFLAPSCIQKKLHFSVLLFQCLMVRNCVCF